MKSLLCALSLLVIMLHYSSTMNMDFDKEKNISLEQLSTTYKQTTLNTATIKSANQQFTDFEEKINEDHSFFKRRDLIRNYFEHAQTQAPATIANAEVVKKFSLIENSFYKQSIEYLIEQTTQSHYKNVTCDTLATIDNPHIPQSLPFLDNLPLHVRAHVMERAYREIDSKKPVIIFDKHIDSYSLRGQVHLAATAHNSNGIFQICDLQTKIIYTLPKKSMCGVVCFSTDGSQLVTVTVTQEEPQSIELDLWNSQTRQNTHTIHLSRQLKLLRLINQDDDTSKLIFIDVIGNLYIYKIKADSEPFLYEYINLRMEFTALAPLRIPLEGEYNLYGSTIYKNSPAFYLCSQATKNTQNKNSLPLIKTALLYLSLAPFEKESINKEIEERKAILAKQEEQKNTFFSWLG